MGVYHEVVLRDSTGEFVERIDPEDYGYSTKVEQAGGRFATTVLPMVIAAAEAHLNRRLSPVWVDDMSGVGWGLRAMGRLAAVCPLGRASVPL